MTRNDGIVGAIGDTPLVRLHGWETPGAGRCYAKLEQLNPGGSAKDRSARAMIDAALADGTLTPGASTVIESSSGNLGVALARLCLEHGIRFECVVDPRANAMTVGMMRVLGATIHVVREGDPVTGDLLVARMHRVQELVASTAGAVTLDQYSNPASIDAHATGTMREICEQLGRAPDVLLVAVSTTGTIRGCMRELEQRGASTCVVAVDAAGSVLFGGERAPRTLPGFGAGTVPPLARDAFPDEIVRVCDIDSIRACRALARRDGVVAGASGGAVAHAYHQLAATLTEHSETVLIIHDGGAPYMETVYDDSWVDATFGAGALDAPAAMAAGVG